VPNFLKRATIAFTAGCLGGLTNSLAVWIFGAAGITALLGVGIAPALVPGWLYPRLVWGGIWGILLLLPLVRLGVLVQGAILSLGPTIVQLFIVFPMKADKGVMGLELGTLTPLFVVFFNLIWGVTAVWWYRATGGR
jgi:hypothetical protein